MVGVHEDHGGELFRGGQAIDSVDFKAQHIPAARVPWDRLALADITEEMMLRAGGELLDLQVDLGLFCCARIQAKQQCHPLEG